MEDTCVCVCVWPSFRKKNNAVYKLSEKQKALGCPCMHMQLQGGIQPLTCWSMFMSNGHPSVLH